MAGKRKKYSRNQVRTKNSAKRNQHLSSDPGRQTIENETADNRYSDVAMRVRSNMLNQSRLSPVQRQEAARQIGQSLGNHQLRKIIEQGQNGAQSEVAQREDETLVERGGGTHEVVAGDSLWRIAEQTYGHGRYWRKIYEANPGKAARGGDLILVGVVLTLPVLSVPENGAPPVPDGGGGVEPAVEIIGLSTEFGSFDIYPDEFVGPLPLSVRNAESWPIRQSDFDELDAQLTAVKDGTAMLSVDGTDAFKTGVYLDLAWLMTSPVGQTLMQELQETSHTVKIVVGAGGNSEDAENFEDGLETTDVPPKAGPGSNATITYNPNQLFIKDGSLAWHHRPPAIGLAHEMVHAWADVHGRSGRGKSGGVHRYELQAVGLDEYRDARISENKFRSAFGLPTRPVY